MRILLRIYTLSHKNVSTLVFDSNADVSWATFTIFAPAKAGMNALTLETLLGTNIWYTFDVSLRTYAMNT